MIVPEDEEVHAVGEGPHWQESWYFNWADPSGEAFGLTRIGFRFRQRRVDALVLTLRGGRPEFVYPAVNLRQRAPWSERSAREGLRGAALCYQMEEPLARWRITLSGKNAMELLWESYGPAFDYREGPSDLPPDVAGRHFEQAGRVTGWTRFRGSEHAIEASGERDKSWGVRDWAQVTGWNWISAQFGEDLSFNLWEGFFGKKRTVNGFVFRDGENHPLWALGVRFRWGAREHVPALCQIDLTDDTGARYQVEARALAQFPLVKSGLYLQETHASFTLESGGSVRRGIGVIEHAWHAGVLGTLRRLPDLLGAAAGLIRP